MKLIVLHAILFSLASHVLVAEPAILPKVTRYELRYNVQPKEEILTAAALMEITNGTQGDVQKVPFLVYRLLKVDRVLDAKGKPISFDQDIVVFRDEPNWQVNAIDINLNEPLHPGKSTEVQFMFHGSVLGYAEVMAYVKDRIGESFSLIRPDALSYPMLAQPASDSLQQAYDTRFTYHIEITVPAGYTVASGGIRGSVVETGKSATYVFESVKPTWRIDIAVAKFKFLQDVDNQLYVYAIEGDEAGGMLVLEGMKRVIDFYRRSFGNAPGLQGYTAIEIPNGWGSQAGDGYFLQEAAAFKDPKRLFEVYHEIAHSWNVPAKDDIKKCRWFDEAFASYFESLAIWEFENQNAFEEHMADSRDIFLRSAEADRRNFDTPIAHYGKEDLGANSYTKGAWSLYVLHQMIGDDKFHRLIRQMIQTFANQPADFADFEKLAETISERDMATYFKEWFYSSESSRLLKEKVSINEIVKRYQ